MKDIQELIDYVAKDCIKSLSDENKAILVDNPCAIDYHFGYCLYIRNHYIHNNNFSDYGFIEPDSLSGSIIRKIFELLLPGEYYAKSRFIDVLYSNEDFLELRKKYKDKFGRYPIDFISSNREKADELFDEYYAKIRQMDSQNDREKWNSVWNGIHETGEKYIRICCDSIQEMMENSEK